MHDLHSASSYSNRKTASVRRRKIGNRFLHRLIMFLLLIVMCNGEARAFTLTDATAFGLGIGRWDAAPHLVDRHERSLDGGLRFSLQGGSYEAYRDLFQWEGAPPSVSEFQMVVETSFAMWEEMDPVTGLGTALRFVPDLDTPVFAEPIPPVGEVERFFKLNRGAEIDLLAAGTEVVAGHGRVVTFGDPLANSVTLTSGVSDYAAAVASGMDLYMSNEKTWNLDLFLHVLSHEVGHTIALHDVDTFSDIGIGGVLSRFYDDNYDDTNQATVRETLNNSFAHLIDPFDPDNSPALGLYDVCYPEDSDDLDSHCAGDPGIDTPGVDLKMESSPNRITVALHNDDFAGRQFLYPFVRTPGDFDADSLLTIQDVDLLSAEIDSPEPRLWFDLNDDGMVDQDDRSVWVSDLKKTFFGDANLDGQVDAADLNNLALSWQVNDATSWAQGDFDGDGNVGATDLNSLALNWRKGSAEAASVPEPSSTPILLIVGFLTLTLRRNLWNRP